MRKERTHSGLELLSMLKHQGLSISDSMFHQVRKLDRSYIDSRYPNAVGGPPASYYDQQTAEELMKWAQSVMDFVRSNLS
jgi:HEPN domain-containing protein